MNQIDQETLIQQNVGTRIRELRRFRGMTAVELASLAGISQSQLSKIETGKATISIKNLDMLCRVLDRPLSYLFQSEQEMPRVLGTLNTVAGPESEGIKRFSQEIRRLTSGRISLIPLRAAQLGPPADQVEQLREGVIDLFVEELAHFHKYVSDLNIFSLPYIFSDGEQLNSFFESSYFQEHICAKLLDHKVRFLNRNWNWKRGLQWVLVSRQPIFSPDQLKGKRIRIYDSKILGRFWEELGAKPVVIAWHEVKDALSRGEVDLVPTHKAHVFPLGFCKYARYVTLLGDTCPVLGVAINELKYRVLPPNIQSALHQASDAAGYYFSRLVRESEQNNELLNISTYQAAYLKVDVTPWKREAQRIRKMLVESGELPSRIDEEIRAVCG